jgi:hypothetical protein
MHQQFMLEIALGNDAMNSSQDVADALHEVGKLIEEGFHSEYPIPDGFSGSIRDVNGNKVGKWEVSKHA